MALSGSFYKYPVQQFGLYCTWSGTQNQTGNYTDVTLNIYLHYETISVDARSNGVANINGSSETFSTSAINDTSSASYHDVLLNTMTVRVPHNSNGTKTSVTLSASWSFDGTYSGTYVGTITASTTVDLDQIDRTAPTVSAEATVISTTSFSIKGTANKTCNKWEYSLDGGSSWNSYSTKSGTSASTTFVGISSKNYTAIKVRATRSDNGVSGTSSEVSADITAPTVSFTVSNITAKSVYINAKSSVTADLWEYSINNGSTWTQFSAGEGTSAEKTITGLSPNTTYQLKVRARKLSNGLYGESAATSIKTPGASVLNSVNDLTIDVTSPSLGFNWTVYSTSYTHSLAIKSGSTIIVTITGLIGNTGTTNKTIALTTAQRTAILNAMSTVQSLSVTYVLTTYSDSTQIGTTSSTTGTIKTTSSTSSSTSTSEPIFTEFTFLDSNSATVELTGNNQLCIQSYSSLQVTCTAAVAQNGASIVKYRASIGEKNVESTSTTIPFGTITDSGKLTLTVTAIDSRGYTTSVSKKITVIAYDRIVINSWNIRRVNTVDETIQLSFAGSISPVLVNNVAKNFFVGARYRYKKSTETSYSSYTAISNVKSDSSEFSFEDDAFMELPTDSPYHIQIEVSDKLDTYTTTLYIDNGTPLVAFRSEKVGINTNDPQAALDVNGSIMMNGCNVQGFMKKLESDTDLNDVLTPGIYFASVADSSDLHYPTTSVGVLEVLQAESYFIMQRYTTVNGKVYNRSKYSTTWYAWA
jgi:hypothetical protein